MCQGSVLCAVRLCAGDLCSVPWGSVPGICALCRGALCRGSVLCAVGPCAGDLRHGVLCRGFVLWGACRSGLLWGICGSAPTGRGFRVGGVLWYGGGSARAFYMRGRRPSARDGEPSQGDGRRRRSMVRGLHRVRKIQNRRRRRRRRFPFRFTDPPTMETYSKRKELVQKIHETIDPKPRGDRSSQAAPAAVGS